MVVVHACRDRRRSVDMSDAIKAKLSVVALPHVAQLRMLYGGSWWDYWQVVVIDQAWWRHLLPASLPFSNTAVRPSRLAYCSSIHWRLQCRRTTPI